MDACAVRFPRAKRYPSDAIRAAGGQTAVPQTATPAIVSASPSVGFAAFVFALTGPAACAVAFGLLFAILGTFNMGPGAWFVGAFYAVWFLPFLYMGLAVPYAIVGIVYALAARRLARPSLLVAVVSGVATGLVCISALYVAGLLALSSGFAIRGADALTVAAFVSNLGALAWAVALGVPPSWWLTRDRTAPPRWV
jgi:hypothetical protein